MRIVFVLIIYHVHCRYKILALSFLERLNFVSIKIGANQDMLCKGYHCGISDAYQIEQLPWVLDVLGLILFDNFIKLPTCTVTAKRVRMSKKAKYWTGV
jgi:hypothetical protein